MLADLVMQLMATTFQQTADGKLCGKCNEWKPYEAFALCSKRGRQRWCRECNAQYRKSWGISRAKLTPEQYA